MNKLFLILLLICLATTGVYAQMLTWVGSGSESDPYEVISIGHLLRLVQLKIFGINTLSKLLI